MWLNPRSQRERDLKRSQLENSDRLPQTVNNQAHNDFLTAATEDRRKGW